MGKAIHQYNLLNHGDNILVAVSGGADSLLLLHFLNIWRKKAPINFNIYPVYLDMGFDSGKMWQILKDHFSKLSLPFYMEKTDFGILAHSDKNRGKSPCFLCSWNRRKRLFELTQVLGCNKIALGHNLDDLIETFFMNICYSGETSTMLPKQEMFKGLITIIRPLAMVDKEKIEKLSKLLKLPVCQNPCPSSGKSERTHIRQLLNELYSKNNKIKGNIANALSNIRLEYLPS